MRFASLILMFTLANCVTNPPEITPCSIYSFNRADCKSTDPRKPAQDKPLSELLGYTCFSPKDRGAVKTYIYEVLKKFEQNGN